MCQKLKTLNPLSNNALIQFKIPKLKWIPLKNWMFEILIWYEKKLVYKSVSFLKRAKRKNERMNIYFNFDDEFIQPRVYFFVVLLKYFYLDVY